MSLRSLNSESSLKDKARGESCMVGWRQVLVEVTIVKVIASLLLYFIFSFSRSECFENITPLGGIW